MNDPDDRVDDGASRAEDAGLAALRMLRSGAPEPAPERLAAGRTRLTAVTAGTRETGLRPAWTRRPKRLSFHPPARRALLAGATAAAVAAGVLVALPGGGSTPPRAASGPETVATVLAAAAEKAEQAPALRPRPGQWVLQDEIGCMNRKCDYNPMWIRGDGALWATLRLPARNPPNLDVRPASRIGGDALSELRADPLATYDAMAQLPTEPHALLQRLSTDPRYQVTWYGAAKPVPAVGKPVRRACIGTSHGGRPHCVTARPGRLITLPSAAPATSPAARPKPTPSEQFWNIIQLMQGVPLIPPQIDAALYRALALIPGIRLLGRPMADGYGRPSTTLVMDRDLVAYGRDGKKQVNHFTDYLFLNPRTYAYQGLLDLSREDGQDFPWEYARRSVAVVGKAGTLPGGALWRPYPLAAPGPLPGR